MSLSLVSFLATAQKKEAELNGTLKEGVSTKKAESTVSPMVPGAVDSCKMEVPLLIRASSPLSPSPPWKMKTLAFTDAESLVTILALS